MNQLKKQIEILIEQEEDKKLTKMMHGETYEVARTEGIIEGLKFIKLLIETNIEIKERGVKKNETAPKTRLII